MNVPKAGDRIGNYLIDELIGQGSFAKVFKARHCVLDQVVAIKIPTDMQYVQNLRREGVAIHGLRHPNIVRAIDLDPYADPPYLVMELVDGASLRNILDGQDALPAIETVVEIFRGILEALKTAHEADIVHRDLKPANVLVARGDDPATIHAADVKVADFGLGKVGGATAASMIQSGSLSNEEHHRMAGTIAYMAPEQRDGEVVDARCDLYACGVVLFEMLTGRRPQGGDLPSQFRDDVPDALDEIFRRCYTHRDRRYATAAEILADLDELAEGPPVARRVAGIPRPPGARCEKCGKPTRAGDQFCIHCGHQLADIVPQCPSCHAYVEAGSRFCIFCGADLRQANAGDEAYA